MNSYSLIINSVAEKLKSGKKVEEIVSDIIENIRATCRLPKTTHNLS
jgi:hypothetical protein